MKLPVITIWQPWATLIMEGVKPNEFRGWPAPRAYRGQRIGIHAGARPAKKAEIGDLLYRVRSRDQGWTTGLEPAERAIELLERFHESPLSLPLASILGTVVLGEPVRASTLGGPQDSDRGDHSVWAWPRTDTVRFEPMVPARGKQGFWIWEAET